MFSLPLATCEHTRADFGLSGMPQKIAPYWRMPIGAKGGVLAQANSRLSEAYLAPQVPNSVAKKSREQNRINDIVVRKSL